MPLWLEIVIPTITGVAGIGLGMMVGLFMGGAIAGNWYDVKLKDGAPAELRAKKEGA